MTRKLLTGVFLVIFGLMMIVGGMAQFLRQGVVAAAQPNPGLIRLHIEANSDTAADQELKLRVRDAILAEVTPLFTATTTVAEAEAAIALAMPQIQQVAAEVLAAYGYEHSVSIELGEAGFPGKAYGETFLPAGEYTALKVKIGEAEGANWWCVLFPPLCFVDWATGVVLEPRPGSGGAETVRLSREEVAERYSADDLNKMPVKVRFAFLGHARSAEPTEPPQETETSGSGGYNNPLRATPTATPAPF